MRDGLFLYISNIKFNLKIGIVMINTNTLIKVAALFICPLSVSAKDALSLIVDKGYNSIHFSLAETPKVINLGTKIQVVSESSASLFDFGEIDRFYYSDEITNVKDINAGNKVSVYPNPCSDYIIVTCRNENTPISVTDISGKTIKMQQSSDGMQHKLILNNLPKGSYILNIAGESVKFIKN